jgi:hypothetical protein
MDKLLDFCPLLEPYGWGQRIIRYGQWLELLGENWTSCDVISLYRRTLRSVLGVNGTIREMMNAEENAAYDMLTDTVTVYRGCDVARKKGICWSLDEEVANAFPFQARFKANSPVLIRARAKKDRILAIKLDRNETELIVFSPRVSKIRDADEAAALRLLDLRKARQNAQLDSLVHLAPIPSYTTP